MLSLTRILCVVKQYLYAWALVEDDKDQNGAGLVAVTCRNPEIRKHFATSQRELYQITANH